MDTTKQEIIDEMTEAVRVAQEVEEELKAKRYKVPANLVADKLIEEVLRDSVTQAQKFKKENDYVPTGYDDLYHKFIAGKSSLCRNIIRKFLPYAQEEEVDEFTHDVFLRCVEKKVLAVFDPAKANFGGVIYFVARTICVNHLSRKSRDPIGALRGGSLVEVSDEEFRPGTYQLDSGFAGKSPEPASEARVTMGRLVAHLQTRSQVNPHDRNFPRLLEMMLEGSTPEECAVALGIGKSTAYKWMELLKAEARSFLG